MGETENAYRILMKKPLGKCPLERLKRRLGGLYSDGS
jgi:hypothetical protein